MKKAYLFVLAVLFVSLQSQAASIEMAITVDDLPTHGKLPPGVSRLDVAQKMLSVLKKYQVPEVYGFINGAKFEFDKDQVQVLKAWRDAGYPLGNHTYTHIDINKVSAQEFNANIAQNEKSLKELSGTLDWKYFRYPYLHEGNDPEKRNSVRKYLAENGYRIAQVTVDFEDWAWNDPYARCLTNKDQNQINLLKQLFLKQAKLSLEQATKVTNYLFKRPIKHILLLHIGDFDADMMDELLKLYVSQGVKFIPLSETIQDDVYKIDPGIAWEAGAEFTFQVMKARGIKLSETGAPELPFPGNQLENICN